MPLFSVLIPSRNRFDLLLHALESLNIQDFDDFEIIISDNASIEPYQPALKNLDRLNIRYFRYESPVSVTENWSRAAQMARGEYVIMLGDDDALTPGMLGRLRGLIERFDRPDVLYVKAYHYAYPGAIPAVPSGYFCSVGNSPLFEMADDPFRLDPKVARDLGRQALRFRHQISFNAQHFVWRRSYLESAAQPFFQSPYPDYFACFLTFLTAQNIVVVPTPEIIIGIAKQSFGHYFATNHENEGFEQFFEEGIDPSVLSDGDEAIARALQLPGCHHYRNWLIAALSVKRHLGSAAALSVDLRRYTRIQAFELAHRTGYLKSITRTVFRSERAHLGLQQRFAERLLDIFMVLDRVASLPRPVVSTGLAGLLNIYFPAKIAFHDIGQHKNIMDAVYSLVPKSRGGKLGDEGRPKFVRKNASQRALATLCTAARMAKARVESLAKDLPKEIRSLLAGQKAAPEAEHPLQRAIERYEAADDIAAAALLTFERDGVEGPLGFFRPTRPLNVYVDPRRNSEPSLHIVLPSVRKEHATGGPNTAFILGALLAREGFRVNFLSTDRPPDKDLSAIKAHVKQLTSLDPDDLGIKFIDADNRYAAVPIGCKDVFLATAWWTAHMARAAARLTCNKRIYYLIQDYETLFYGASENFVDAEATYSFDHYPIINSSLLRDHLAEQGVGRFESRGFAQSAAAFDPAVDRAHFYPVSKKSTPRRLLFYARPTLARRNLFGLGVAALRVAVESGLFGDGGWEFVGMGEPFTAIPLGGGYELKPAPWLDFSGYSAQMRDADILLSLMLSPHPSYPPLEMAACGGVTVTTSFGSKTAERLAQISPAIIGVDARLEDLADGLSRAVMMSNDRTQRATLAQLLRFPATWVESLVEILPPVTAQLRRDGLGLDIRLPEPVSFIRADAEIGRSPPHYVSRTSQRARQYRAGSNGVPLSLVTTVFDTDPIYLSDLAHTVFGQDGKHAFEWLVLDNGSSEPGTVELLQEIARHPCVRFARVKDNLGIIGGMRWCLENARGDYVLPVDSDDLLFPDAMRTVMAALEQAGLPVIAYTDEDKTEHGDHRDWYIKPDWDPVLFSHSCYIAHLTVIDRRIALELDCYNDPRCEGSHDWDTFVRFVAAGHVPFHIPEVLYSWRMHQGSTSGNYRSKNYIFESQRTVLEKFVASRSTKHVYEIASSPLFDGAPDWRFVPKSAGAESGATGARGEAAVSETVRLPSVVKRDWLAGLLAVMPARVDCLHLIASDCEEAGELSAQEAATMFDLFPDTAMVGGRIHDGSAILEAGYVFGYGAGIGSPDIGRSLGDPGYFAQMWKPHSVAAVSARHCFIRRDFLERALERLPQSLNLVLLGPWLGGIARTLEKRVIYSPYVEAKGNATDLSREDIALFNAHFGFLSTDDVGYPAQLDRSGAAAYQPQSAVAQKALLPYPSYFQRRLAERIGSLGRNMDARAPTVSILTTVYSRTDAEHLRQTADCVRTQTRRPLEWVVLAHGPVSGDVEMLLTQCAEEGLLTYLRLDDNLGICGGLRFCLEHARGDFALLLDADDLLAPDAVALLIETAVDKPEAALIYSDEDHFIAGEPKSPFFRPDFDPALLLSHSYIWHTLFFRRDIALKLGAFTHREAEYAQDWDLVIRFYLAGYVPVHLSEVLYHWRQHAVSLSNSGQSNEGSVKSVAAVLDLVRSRARNPDLYEIAPFPIDLGAPDLHLLRRALAPPSVARVRMGAVATSEIPFSAEVDLIVAPGIDGLERLEEVVETVDADYVFLQSGAIASVTGLWQAVKQVELVAACAGVSGPILRRGGTIHTGAFVQRDRNSLIDLIGGNSWCHPGAFSLAVKPHCVSAIAIDMLLVDRAFLMEALRRRPDALRLRSLGAWLGAFAEHERRWLVYEPLLRGTLNCEADLVGDEIEGLNVAWKQQIVSEEEPAKRYPLRGLSSFELHGMMHGA